MQPLDVCVHKVRKKTANYAPCDVVPEFTRAFFTFKVIYGFATHAQM